MGLISSQPKKANRLLFFPSNAYRIQLHIDKFHFNLNFSSLEVLKLDHV